MQLQLAQVLSNSETGCFVQIIESNQKIDAQYSDSMAQFNIVANPNDLVAITGHNGSFFMLYRWRRVQVEKKMDNCVLVQDDTGNTSELSLSPDLAEKVVVGTAVYADNLGIADIIVNDQPANPHRLQNVYFPRIKAMNEG
jgi:hypothetical protein